MERLEEYIKQYDRILVEWIFNNSKEYWVSQSQIKINHAACGTQDEQSMRVIKKSSSYFIIRDGMRGKTRLNSPGVAGIFAERGQNPGVNTVVGIRGW
jgi:hypothetical protein